MPDTPNNLVPAERYELLFDLKMALTRTKKFNKQDRADLIASMAAEHVLEHLERSRYVIMQRAPGPLRPQVLPAAGGVTRPCKK